MAFLAKFVEKVAAAMDRETDGELAKLLSLEVPDTPLLLRIRARRV